LYPSSISNSPLIEELNEPLDKALENDAEGVWSPDIEQSFHEALSIYPPCGRRKIILSDEGKMYGRNELIARYIKLRTGKTRTRKQVGFVTSLHFSPICFLACLTPGLCCVCLQDQAAKDKALQSMATISATAFQNKMALQGLSRPPYPTAGGVSSVIKPFPQQSYVMQTSGPPPITGYESMAGLSMSPGAPPWQGRSIASSKLRMLEFSAFLEQPQDPETADLSANLQEDRGFFYGVSSQYESSENMIITSSTKVCSFGKQVVEKVETEYARFENGRYVFRIHRSPLCEYMINFIHKLKHLPEKYMMNSVLENFTILQVVINRDTLETLLCIAYVFEVSTSEHGAQHHIYRLVKD
uniref:Transcriptional enhancer factor TEF-3-like n=1 Tax=Salmo trutta TaxID=8032 RepID=A0A673X910_SALTR